jgi:hypothetical protein
MKRRKIWMGLSTAVLAASPALVNAAPGTALPTKPGIETASRSGPQMAQHKGHGAKTGKAVMSAGGEGEGGEGEGGGGAELPAALSFYRDVGLIRGHLLIGGELIEAGRWAEALPHFLHPEEEIYAGMRPNLKTFNVAPFQTALKALTQTVKAKNKEAYTRARAALDERLATAEAGVRGKEADVPAFTLETVMEILQTAADEYEEAVKGNRIANIVEYQDARGFVHEADRLVSAQADALSAKNPDAVKTIRASLADLKTIFPTPMPPKQAVKDHAQFLSDLSRIELQVGSLR